MGSALSVLLSFTRHINLSLIISIAIKFFWNPTMPSRLPMESLFLFIFLGWTIFEVFIGGYFLTYSGEQPWHMLTNYFSSSGLTSSFRTNGLIEIGLVYVMLMVLYYMVRNQDQSGQAARFLIGFALFYSYFVYISIFPDKDGGSDRIAADNFWGIHRDDPKNESIQKLIDSGALGSGKPIVYSQLP